MTYIGDGVFEGCSSLTSVKIPDSVTYIGWSAFSGCSGLTSIKIPDSVTSIGNYALAYCSSLTSINIPDSVTYIGIYAFRGCASLDSLVIIRLASLPTFVFIPVVVTIPSPCPETTMVDANAILVISPYLFISF